MWAWETEAVPETWKTISKSADEVWATSQYVADSLRRALDVPVHPIHMGFELGPIREIDLGTYGVPAKSFVFLFIFDLSSTLERKNPLGLIAAFRHAFRREENATLIIKVTRGAHHPEDLDRLKRAAKSAARS